MESGARAVKKCLLLFLLLLMLPFSAGADTPVSVMPEAEPFPEDAALLEIWALPLLNADCFFLRCGEETMLLDCGTKGSGDLILDFLREMEVKELTLAYNSHPHDDHLGGFPAVLAQVPAGEFLTTFPENQEMDETIQTAALGSIRESGVPIRVLENGGQFTLGGAEITAYFDETAGDANSRSGVLKITYGNAVILFPGDAEGETLQRLCETYGLDADILKYPHHGRFPLRDGTLNAVTPAFVLIPNGPIGSALGGLRLDARQIPHLAAAPSGVYLATDGLRWAVSLE